ncbi:ABC transporter substrate-binding protein [Paenibacillus harenae]|uniref:ABC transporter substrate-binding protein n=1 Tax=Paenibacillus harenae TaxID=306543 RepID=UPI000419B742|nr:extracellular solute-binding protein [Paenibacillus harenae]
MQRLRISALLVILGSLAVLTSCGIFKGSGTAVEDNSLAKPLSFTMVYAKDDLLHKQGISSVIGAFEKSHPNIVIDEANETWTGSYGEYLKMKEAVGEFPDLVEMSETQLFADAGLLHEIPGDLVNLLRVVPKVNGRFYNLPLDLPAPQGIIYSKSIFRNAGIDAPPRTFGEFMEACEKIKRLGIDPIVVGAKDIGHMGYWINKFLIDEVYIHNPDWNAQRSEGKVSWTDPGPMKAMNKLASLWEYGYVALGFLATTDNQTASILVSGQAAMLLSGPLMFNQIKAADPSFEYGFFALPDDNGKINVAGAQAPVGWSISAKAAKDPDKLKAITQFLHYFYNEDQYSRYLQAVNGIPSTNVEIDYPLPEAMSGMFRVLDDPKTGKSMFMDRFSGRNIPPPQFSDWFYQTAQDWLTGKTSVEAAMKEADRMWDALKQ